MTALARTSSNCKRQIRFLVRQGAPNQQTRNCQTIIKIWSYAPEGCFIPRQTGRLTVGPNITLTFQTHVEAGSNTSTVILQVVGGYENGSLESETVKYDHGFYGTGTRKWLRCRGPAEILNDRPVLWSERVPQINKPANIRQ
jgi:hypothetical protein